MTHHHPPKTQRLGLALILTSFILLAEIIGGLWSGSLALLADAGHVFTDAFALFLSYLAVRAASRPADERHTYGYHRLQILAALLNGLTLVVIAVEVAREAWARWQTPHPIAAGLMLTIALIGLAVNVLVAFILHEHDHDDVNLRAAYLHVLGDSLASVGVIGAGVAILITGWVWLDALVSVLIAGLILFSAVRLLKDTLHILVEGTPQGADARAVVDAMTAVPGVQTAHDVHIWTIGPGYHALSAHVVLEDQALSATAEVMQALKATLRERFAIEHTTIQFECVACNDAGVCGHEALASAPEHDAHPI